MICRVVDGFWVANLNFVRRNRKQAERDGLPAVGAGGLLSLYFFRKFDVASAVCAGDFEVVWHG